MRNISLVRERIWVLKMLRSHGKFYGIRRSHRCGTVRRNIIGIIGISRRSIVVESSSWLRWILPRPLCHDNDGLVVVLMKTSRKR